MYMNQARIQEVLTEGAQKKNNNINHTFLLFYFIQL
jgi:hypothetical protein